MNRAEKIPSQEHGRVLINSGNPGIGFQALLDLARSSTEVIFNCRSNEKSAGTI